MPGIGPVAHLQENRLEEADLDDLAADALNLHPIADAHAVAAHQEEPAEEREEEVFQRHGQTGGGQADDGRGLARRPEHDQENHQPRGEAHGQHAQEALLVHAAAILPIAEGMADTGFDGHRGEQESQHEGQRPKQQMQYAEPPRIDESDPGLVCVVDLLAVLNAAVKLHQGLALVGEIV